MVTSLRRSLAMLAALLLIATGLLFASPFAKANYPPATLSRTLYLTQYPYYNPIAYVSRQLYLAAGNYGWSVSLTDDQQQISLTASLAQRDIYLAAGNYTWTCYVVPGNGDYYDGCQLSSSNGPNAYIQSVYFTIPESGNYTIFAQLYPYF